MAKPDIRAELEFRGYKVPCRGLSDEWVKAGVVSRELISYLVPLGITPGLLTYYELPTLRHYITGSATAVFDMSLFYRDFWWFSGRVVCSLCMVAIEDYGYATPMRYGSVVITEDNWSRQVERRERYGSGVYLVPYWSTLGSRLLALLAKRADVSSGTYREWIDKLIDIYADYAPAGPQLPVTRSHCLPLTDVVVNYS